MHIKEIKFINFKTFGKETKIQICEDLSTVCDPNGNYESDIRDGILFALGFYDSMTHQNKMFTDLMDNEDTTKGSKFAQVTVKFDNTNREIPVDNDEVTISHKIMQTELAYNSYLYLNGEVICLKDLNTYFAKAQIVPDGHS